MLHIMRNHRTGRYEASFQKDRAGFMATGDNPAIALQNLKNAVKAFAHEVETIVLEKMEALDE